MNTCPKHDTGGGPCYCPASPESEAIQPDSIEYGGVVWLRDKGHDKPTYSTMRNHVWMRVSMYALDDEPHVAGRWCCHAHFDSVPDIGRPDVLLLNSHRLADTREDAMAYCINALDDWLDDMQRVLHALRPSDPYQLGFIAGQQDIKTRVAEVIA